MEDQGCEGFAQVVVAPSMRDGVRGLLQSAGLGGLTPNLLVLRYPERWRSISDVGVNLHSKFTGVLRDAFTSGKGIVLIADADKLPHAKDKASLPISPNTPTTIDLYWVVRDGGLMLLLAQVLMRSSPFRRCAMRVFVVSECAAKSEPLRQDVKRFLYELRIDAEVVVLEMDSLEEREEEPPEGFDEYQNFILHGSNPGKEEDDGGLHNDVGDAGRRQHRHNGRLNGAHTISPSSSPTSSRQSNGGGPSGLLRSKSLNSPGCSPAQRGASSLSDAELRRIDRSICISLKINRLIRSHSCSSSPASIVLVSLPPPPANHPPRNYMTYLDALIHGISTPLLLVRGYRRAVVTLYT